MQFNTNPKDEVLFIQSAATVTPA